MIAAEIVGGLVTIIGSIIAGWFAWATKKASARSPETVAGGYTVLVSDMRAELTRLTERVQYLEEERTALNQKVASLNNQIGWLLENASDYDRAQFNAYFKKE